MPQNPRQSSDPEIDRVLSGYVKKKVREEATRQGVPEDFADRMASAESAYKPDVIKGQRKSRVGAQGPMQLMPGTARDLKVDPDHINQNIEGGVRYAKQQLDAFGGDQRKASAAYNWGPGNVRKFGTDRAPAETRAYMDKVGGDSSSADPEIEALLQAYQARKTTPQPQRNVSPGVFKQRPQAPNAGRKLAENLLDFRSGQNAPMAQAARLDAAIAPEVKQQRETRDARMRKSREEYDRKSFLGRRASDVASGLENIGQSGQRAFENALTFSGVRDVLEMNDTAKNALAEGKAAQQYTAQKMQEEQAARNAMASQVTRGLTQGAGGAAIMAPLAMTGGVPALMAGTGLQQDWENDPKGALLNTATAGVPVLAGKAIAPIAGRAAMAMPRGLQKATQLGIEGAAGGAANAAQYAGTQAVLGREINPEEALVQGVTGAALSGAMAPKLGQVRRQIGAQNVRAERPTPLNALPERPVVPTTQGPTARTPITTEAIQAANRPPAPAQEMPVAKTAPMPAGNASASAVDRAAFPDGSIGDMEFLFAQQSAKPKTPVVEKGSRSAKPVMSADDLRNQVIQLQADAVDAENAGNYEVARTKYRSAQDVLRQMRADARKAGDAEGFARLTDEANAANRNWQIAGTKAARLGRQKPVASSDETLNILPDAPTKEVSAPLLRPEAQVNPEGGKPEIAPEPVDFARLANEQNERMANASAKPAKRLITRIAEMGGINMDKHGGEMQSAKDARRVGLLRRKGLSPDLMAQQLRDEGFDVDPNDLNTLWRAIDDDVAGQVRPQNTRDLNERLAKEESEYYNNQDEQPSGILPKASVTANGLQRGAPENTGSIARVDNRPSGRLGALAESERVESVARVPEPSTSDLQPAERNLRDIETEAEIRAAANEYGQRAPVEPEFTQEPPEQRDLGRRITPFRPPSPFSPRIVGNRAPALDVNMSAQFPVARRALAQAGAPIQAEIDAGRAKAGQYGKAAQQMFKSSSGKVLHGQDSFFHDPQLKGKLGLSRDAEMGEVKSALTRQLARFLRIKEAEVSLTQIKPEVWRQFAAVKGLGRDARAKMELALARGSGNAEKTVSTSAERSEGAVLESTPDAKTNLEIRTAVDEGKAPDVAKDTGGDLSIAKGDRVTWRDGKSKGQVLKIVGNEAIVDEDGGVGESRLPLSQLKSDAAKSGFSFGALKGESKGPTLTAFGGQGFLDKLRANARPQKPKEIPADFNPQTWARKASNDLASRFLSDAERSKLNDPATTATERKQIFANAQIDPATAQGVASAMRDVYDALQAKDYNGFQDAALRVKALTDAPSTNLEKVSAFRKAMMLSRPVSHLRNMVGNTTFQVLEEAARIPGSAADMMLTGITGRRALGGASSQDFAQGVYAAATDGWQAAKDAMKGRNADEIQKALQVKDVRFNNKIVDNAVKYIFRSLAAEDQIFFTGAYERAIRESARLTAQNEARAGVIAKSDIRRRQNQLLAGPTEAMEIAAKQAAEVAVFRNSNRLSEGVAGFREKIGDKANFALDFVLPFDKTPTNVVLRALEYSPIGLGRGVTGAVAGASRAVRARKAAGKAGLPTRTDVQATIDKAFTPEQQRNVTQLIGRGTVGTGLMAMGYALASKGLMTGFYEESDAKLEAQKRAVGAQPLAIKIGGRWYGLGGIGPIGLAMGMGATMHDEAQKKEANQLSAGARAAKEMVFELPALESLKNATKDSSKVFNDFANTGKFAGNIAGSFIPGVLNDAGQVIPGVRDEFEREIKQNPKKVKGSTRAGREFGASLLAKIPGARRALPVKRDALGNPVKTEWSDVLDPFSSRPATGRLPVKRR